MTDLTALDVIQSMKLDMTMVMAADIGVYADTDDKSRAIVDMIAADLLYRFSGNFDIAQQFANKHGLALTVTLA